MPWICERQNDCKYHVDVNENTDQYCLGVLARRADCQGFVPKRVSQTVTGEQDLPFYTRVERANPGYLVFFDGIEQNWYKAFGQTAVVLGREFRYRVNRGTTGIEKINWEAGKRIYLAKGYGIILKRGNVEKERIAPQETQPEQVTQPERETQPEEVTQSEECNREDRNDHVRARSYGQLRRDYPGRLVIKKSGCFYSAYNDCAEKLAEVMGFRLGENYYGDPVTGSQNPEKMARKLREQRISFVIVDNHDVIYDEEDFG